MAGEVERWLWQYVDEHGKARVTRYRLTEADARARYGESVQRVENSREAWPALGNTSDFLKRS